MKRSLLVAAGTAAGVTAVVSYHATSASPTRALTGSAVAAATHSTRATTTSADTPTTRSSTTTATTTTTTSTTRPRAARTRSAVGEAVAFQYGQIAVRVTEHAGRIVNVSIASLQIADPHSQSIDAVAVPQLRSEVLAAQSAHIDGVSGASYTAQAYAQSVQSAIDRLA